jgi:cation diffusion facilitator family transporter
MREDASERLMTEEPVNARAEARCSLGWVVALNLGLAAVQIIVGTGIKSLALVSDGFHNLSDAGASMIAQLAEAYQGRPYDARALPFGYDRASCVGALVNVAALEAVCLSIALAALCRLVDPRPVERPGALLWVSAAGVVVNVASAVLSCWSVVEHHHVGCACRDDGADAGADEEAPRVEKHRVLLCASACCAAGGAATPKRALLAPAGVPFAACVPCRPCAPVKTKAPLPAPAAPEWGARLDVGRLALVAHHAGDALMCLAVLGEALVLRRGHAWLAPGAMAWLRRYLDPLLSLALSLCVGAMALPVGKRAAWTLMEGAPRGGGAALAEALDEALAGRARVTACALLHLRDAPGLSRAALVRLELAGGRRADAVAAARRVLARFAASAERTYIEVTDAAGADAPMIVG